MAGVVPDLSETFAPLANLANVYRQSRQQAAREQVLGQLGQGSGPLDYGTAARQLLAAGDTEGGLSLAKLAEARYLHSPEYITQSETAKAKVAEQFAPKTANIKLPDGTEVTAQKTSTGYSIPKIEGMVPPDPNAPQPPPGVDVKKWREARATQLGNIDDKAVLEADKAVQAGSAAVDALNRAVDLSKVAISGPLAAQRGYLQSFTPEWINAITGAKDSGIATEKLTNIVTTQALENLRSIFGGNPTEGERGILLKVQGAVNQAPEVREAIYKEAIDAANKRIDFNKRNAEQMRGGRYLLPESQRNAPATAPTMPKVDKARVDEARANPAATLLAARTAIESGKAREPIIQFLRAAGIDPAGL